LADTLHLNLIAVEAQIFPIMRIHCPSKPSTVVYLNIDQPETDIYITTNQAVQLCRTVDLTPQPNATTILAEQVEQVIDKYLEKGGRQPSQVFLLGPGAANSDFRQALSSAIPYPVKISDPFSGLSYPQGIAKTLVQKGPLFTVATGLAARQINNL